ncbi:MAG TPA: ankyrin repeat domain-containing protein, partial [Phycisphaerae bacterium]|nr:ankyrin repeat domain-containing protein [Phycisphaerae bacterium]
IGDNRRWIGDRPGAKRAFESALAALVRTEKARQDPFNFSKIAVSQAGAGLSVEARRTVEQYVEFEEARQYVREDLASALARAGDFPAALETAATITSPMNRGLAYARIAEDQAIRGDPAGARKTIELAERAKAELKDPPGEKWVAREIATARQWAGDLASTRPDEAGIRDPHEEASAYVGIARDRLRAGDRAGAREIIEQALGAAARQPDPYLRTRTYCNIAVAQAQADDVDGARESFRKAKSAAARTGGSDFDHAHVELVSALLRVGDIEGAKGLATPRFIPEPEHLDMVRGDIAQAQAEAGDFQGARSTVGLMAESEWKGRVSLRVALQAAKADPQADAWQGLASARQVAEKQSDPSAKATAYEEFSSAYAEAVGPDRLKDLLEWIEAAPEPGVQAAGYLGAVKGLFPKTPLPLPVLPAAHVTTQLTWHSTSQPTSQPDGYIETELEAEFVAIVKKNMARGLDPDTILKGESMLHVAGELGFRNAAQILLDHSASVDIRDAIGRTPLLRAAFRKHEAVVALLLDRGADVKAVDKVNGMTPLHAAAFVANIPICRLLIAKGADVNARDRNGGTPLMGIAQTNAAEIAKVLIEAGADVKAKANDGGTALHRAAAGWAEKEMAELLIAHGADINAKDNAGRTPISYTAGSGNEVLAELLSKLGAK